VNRSTIVDDLQESQSTNPTGCRVAHFYCDFRQRHSFTVIGSSLLKQIVTTMPTIPERLGIMFDASMSEAESPDEFELEYLIEEVLKSIGEAFIVIDAIDELLEEFSSQDLWLLLMSLRVAGASVLLLSSHTTSGLRLLDLEDAPRIVVQAMEEDIRAYVEHQLDVFNLRDLIHGKLRLNLLQRMTETSKGR
jgi:hypothetical protein